MWKKALKKTNKNINKQERNPDKVQCLKFHVNIKFLKMQLYQKSVYFTFNTSCVT